LDSKVRAWVNDDDEIVFVEKKTSDNDIYVDVVEGVDGDDVELHILVADDAVIYVNFKSAKLTALQKNYYGRFVEKNNEIVFASLFNFAQSGVVTDVTGSKIKYFQKSDSVKTLDLTKADAVTVYNPDLTVASFDDITTDSVIYWWETSDEYHIVVVNNAVEGTVERIQSKKVRVDDTTYTFENESVLFPATYSLDEDDNIEEYPAAGGTDAIEDFDGEEVVALLDLKGHVRHLRSAVDTKSGTQYGIVVGAPKYNEVSIFTQDGEEVTYRIEDRGDYGRFENYDFYKLRGEGLDFAAIAYKLNADGEVVESEKDDPATVGLKWAATIIEDEDVDGLNVTTNKEQYFGNLSKEDDETLVTLGIGESDVEFFVRESTVIMRAINSDKELDPEIIAWEDFEELGLDDEPAVVFGKEGKTAKFIVFLEPDFEGAQKDTYYGIATGDAYRSGGKWRVEVETFDGGEDVYVAKDGTLKEGNVFSFYFNSKGELVPDLAEAVDVDDADVDDGYLEVGSTVYRFDANALIYQLESDGDIDYAITVDDLEDKEDGSFTFVAKGRVIKVLAYTPVDDDGDDDDDDTEGLTVEHVSDVGDIVVVDGVAYKVVATTLVYTNDNLEGAGPSAVLDAVDENDVVDIVVSKNVDSEGNPILSKIVVLE
jgi:hypothetical protein